MANHKSAAKRAKQSEARRLRNKSTRSSMNTAVKKVRTAKEAGTDNATDLLNSAKSLIAKAAKKGVIHQNTAARKISRLTKSLG
ncbi:RpsT [Desulforapulum autotrophicum HRM2]|uniref:Small ribosomal subunit protein bS20 n=1 Tax=Desulforapulum autotrophicum (strain ATCC 43914 / DSM 3382 / VKM B-1955 / HRM2) TaxID=177437 RepID=RS20_DESAH|nr:30S ribosomal protein S20 [Desulforapulum autotrophicum]C0QI73.1 RecName: Full=Small ribosomal subunit protein bS20; AltName: Full=30S ribosomal protein S20 [Desulforapulum autotrophicum HRM2]ACN15809.1 RpsT [Desulforapulum autotrophicum HRM2]